MKVPSFRTKKIREDILELVEFAPTRGMYEIVLLSIDHAMDDLLTVREKFAAEESESDVMEAIEAWDAAFGQFGEREAYYYKAFTESKDRSTVDAPLFKGNYDGFSFTPEPDWPDIETPWRLANDLSTIAASLNADQEFLDDLEQTFKDIVSEFWIRANILIVKKKMTYEEEAAAEDAKEGEGKVFGFWPVIAVGAAALAGALGGAAGYTAAKSNAPEGYVDMSPFEKHIKYAKTVGIGALIGAALAVIFILRIRR